MPPNNTPVSSEGSNSRKRAASERVVPAIPLALSKPKPSIAKPKAEVGPKAEADSVTQGNKTAPAPNGQTAQRPVTNGESHAQVGADSVQPVSVVDDRVKMPPPADTPSSRGSGPMSISNGATPDPPNNSSARPSTPPAVSGAPTESPPSARKPSDRFDMRQIRTELPPAFIPSAEQHTPRSAGSSGSNRPPVFHSHAHPARPSTSSIVFGSHNSSNSSPAPPQSAGSAFFPPPYPSFGAPQPSSYGPATHSHNTSEPHGPRTYQPGGQHQPIPWNTRQGYAQPAPQAPSFHPHAHMPFRYPREAYTPVDFHQQQLNGRSSRSRSVSQASSGAADQQKPAQPLQSPLAADGVTDTAKMMFPEPKAAFQGQVHPHPPQFNSQTPLSPQFPHPDIASSIENAEAIRNHVHVIFSNQSFTDCQLQIQDDSDGSTQTFNGHRLVLSRSPLLLSLIQSSEPPSSSSLQSQLYVSLEGPYIRMDAFMDALKYIYGGPLLQLDHHRPGSSASEQQQSNVERMEHALQTIATGAWLKLPAIAARGVEVAGGLLHWDTISSALTFALEGGLSHIWTVDDGSQSRASTTSSDDSLVKQEMSSSPSYDPYSTHLLQRIIDFTVHVFPLNFYLDAAAPQLISCPRLPSLPLGHESRPSRSDPRLSQIRFGDIPIEDHQRPSFATTTVSSVLLSIPFPILKYLLENFDLSGRLGPDTVASIMRQVVAERETRRTKALKARVNNQLDESVDAHLMQNLYWEEFVEPSHQHRAGFRLARRQRGIDTPSSSEACSERNK